MPVMPHTPEDRICQDEPGREAGKLSRWFAGRPNARQDARSVEELSSWLPMETAPKDGTLVRLLVDFEHHATEDAEGPQPTIGSNTWDNHHDFDEWQFAGWNWEQDCYTQGVGKPIGWLPMLDTPVATPVAAVAQPVAIDRDALVDLIAEHLSGTYHCLRVWSAWSVGTMSQDDFQDVGESDTPSEIADAILALAASPSCEQSAADGEVDRG